MICSPAFCLDLSVVDLRKYEICPKKVCDRKLASFTASKKTTQCGVWGGPNVTSLFWKESFSPFCLVMMTMCFLHICPAGVPPSERGLVWRFLFGMYPCSSTALERSYLHEQLAIRYQVMKRKWQRCLPSAVRMHLNGTDGKRPSPAPAGSLLKTWSFLRRTYNSVSFPAELVQAVTFFDQRRTQTQQQTREQSEDVKDRLVFLQLQAQVSVSHCGFQTVARVQQVVLKPWSCSSPVSHPYTIMGQWCIKSWIVPQVVRTLKSFRTSGRTHVCTSILSEAK